jgi:hypothetical protein
VSAAVEKAWTRARRANGDTRNPSDPGPAAALRGAVSGCHPESVIALGG